MILAGQTKEAIKSRTNAIAKDLLKRHNLAELRREKYAEQKGECEFCHESLVSTKGCDVTIDHATSKLTYAASRIPIRKACELANSKKNLVAVHPKCNGIKSFKNMDEIEAQDRKGVAKTKTKTEDRERMTVWLSNDSLANLRKLQEKFGVVVANLVRFYVEDGLENKRHPVQKGK
jgi:hypothetical protein